MKKFSIMSLFLASLLIIIICSSSCLMSYAQSCDEPKGGFSNNKIYAGCNALPTLDSFLHWNYHPSNNTVDLAYRHANVTANNWIAWALNPSGGRMVGSQCLVAFRNSSGQIRAYTSPIADYRTTLQEGPLSFPVPRIEAEFAGNQMIIYATIQLPNNTTSFTHLWQYGGVSGNTLMPHSFSGQNTRSYGTIDFATGITGATAINRGRKIHGILNVVSWGILVPMGAMIARYKNVFPNPAAATAWWFYIHVIFQTSGYIVGVAGWGTGLRLGSESVGVRRSVHRNIGITIFALATLQLFAFVLRPKPDHKYRIYWNIYHKAIGYTVIILSIFNIFKGFDILDLEDKWRWAYIGVLIFLGATAVVLETYSWYLVVLKGKRSSDNEHTATKGTHEEVNGYYGV